jgi:cation diffusion facilitator CzcD-associated flavoprotein CzcO
VRAAGFIRSRVSVSVFHEHSFLNAEFVIVGGGAVGVGCAYALAKAGKTDVLVLERADEVGAVTTSAGRRPVRTGPRFRRAHPAAGDAFRGHVPRTAGQRRETRSA